MAANQGVRAELLELELRLIEPEFRRDRARVEKLLAPGFVEFGSSGRVWSRDEILSYLETEAYERPEIVHFECRALCDEIALVTYRSVHAGAEAGERIEVVRSSIWRKGSEGWEVCFHQGTRAKPMQSAE